MTAYLVLAVRVMTAVVLLAAFWSKTGGRAAFAGFRSWLLELTVVPRPLVVPVAVVLVAAEATTVVLLAVPATQVLGLLAASAVIGFFCVAIAWLSWRRIRVPCRCFGTATRPLGVVEIVRNGVLATAAGWAAVNHAGPAPDAVLAVLLGLGVAAIVVRLDDVVTLFAPVGKG